MDKRLANSFFFDAHRVYGYTLEPFCLLHSLQLEALESPLVTGGKASPADLIVAAQVCASHDVRTSYKRHPWRMAWRSFEQELAKWDAYFDNCTSGPHLYSRPSGGGGSLNAPWQQIIATRLQKDLGMSYRDAWTLPEGRVLWEFYSLREQQEEDSMILSDQQEEVMEGHLDEMESAAVADKLNALNAREDAIEAGTWPLDERGRPVPLNFKTLTPDV